MDRDSLVVLLGHGLSVEEIGRRFDRHPSTVSYWLRKHGLDAVKKDKHAARGGIDPVQLTALVEAGLTVAQIAAEVELSKTSVRYWLRAHGLRTRRSSVGRSSEPAPATTDGAPTVTMLCRHHGQAEFLLEGRGYLRCKQCRVDAVNRRRRRVKAILVAEAGGRCVICGYDRYAGALEFHHLDPLQKRIEVNARGSAVALETLRREARKCVLLCSNCHAEVEGGAATLPVEYLRAATSPIHPNPG